MSGEEEMGSEFDCGAEAAAFVLGAMDEAEAHDFRAHLAGCTACQEEVASLRQTVDVLPMTAPQISPSPQLRKRVMAEVRQDARARRSHEARQRSPGRAWTPRRALAGAGVLIAAGAAAIVIVLTGGSGSPSTRIVAKTSSPTARAYIQVNHGLGALHVSRMPAPPRGKIYEVWIKRGSAAPIPTDALFDVDRSGGAVVAVPASLQGVSAVMVTAEPAGGSGHPTSPPVVIVRITPS